MASAEIVSNLKLITSGNVPTTSNLGNGELAFGLVDGVAKLYGNVNGTIVDFSDFLRTAPVTSVAGKTGAVSLAKDDVGLGNVDNVKQYSASNPPPYPVTSVAGKTGTVILSAEDVGAEPAFHKNTAFNKNFGNISGTVAQGNDSRIVNAVQTSGDQAIWGKKTFMTSSPVVPSKTRKATNSGTSIATEAQVYKVEQELSEKQDALTSQQIVNINNVPNKLDKNLGTGLAGQFLVVGDNGDIITTDTIDNGGSGGGNIGSYWAMMPSSSIPTSYGDFYISFSFTTNNGYDENLIHSAELKDILLASSVNIYRTQTDYANKYPEIDLGELYSHIYNGDGLADGKQIIRGKATLADGGNTSYDCLLFVCEDVGGGNEKLELGIIYGDGHVRINDEIKLDGTMSFFVAVFYLGGSY